MKQEVKTIPASQTHRMDHSRIARSKKKTRRRFQSRDMGQADPRASNGDQEEKGAEEPETANGERQLA